MVLRAALSVVENRRQSEDDHTIWGIILRFTAILLAVAVFSRAVFQVAQRVTSGSPVKTVVFSTRLKLSESANFNGILIKFKPLNQVA